jgi:hypothetical protein
MKIQTLATALFSFVLLFACKTQTKIELDNTLPKVSTYEDLTNYISKEIIAEGIIVEEKFVNKGGKEMNFTEFWLEMNDKHRILLRQKGNAKAKDFLNKKVKTQGNLFYGNVDSDNPNAQSRVGYRLDYTNIAETK